MAQVNLHITPLAVYLLALALYSTVMLLSTLDSGHANQYQYQGPRHQYQSHVDQKRSLSEYRHFKSRRGGWWPRRVVDDLYNTMKRTETSCTKLLHLGGTSCKRSLDNMKYVCLDEDVMLTPQNCTVFSLGIGDDATFDDQIRYFGCHVFDPTLNKGGIIKSNITRQNLSLLGLPDRNDIRTHEVTHQDNNKTEIIADDDVAYDTIRYRLAHHHPPVHYLKIDVGSREWRALWRLVQLVSVRQLAILVHTSAIITAPHHKVPGLLHDYWRMVRGLTRLGFLRAHYYPDVVPGENRTIPACFHVLYLRRGPTY